MCLAVPGRVISISTENHSRQARVAFGAVIKQISLDLLPEAAIDDYVIVHAGVAISVLDPEEAQAVFRELDALEASRAEEDAL